MEGQSSHQKIQYSTIEEYLKPDSLIPNNGESTVYGVFLKEFGLVFL